LQRARVHYAGLPESPAQTYALLTLQLVKGVFVTMARQEPEGWAALMQVLGPEQPQAALELRDLMQWAAGCIAAAAAAPRIDEPRMVQDLLSILGGIEVDEVHAYILTLWPRLESLRRDAMRAFVRQGRWDAAFSWAQGCQRQPAAMSAEQPGWQVAKEAASERRTDFDPWLLGAALVDPVEWIQLQWVGARLTWQRLSKVEHPRTSSLWAGYQAVCDAAERWRMAEAAELAAAALRQFEALAAPSVADASARGFIRLAQGIVLGWIAMTHIADFEVSWKALLEGLEGPLPLALAVAGIQGSVRLLDSTRHPDEREALVACVEDMAPSLPAVRSVAVALRAWVQAVPASLPPPVEPPTPREVPSMASLAAWMARTSHVRVMASREDGGDLLLECREPGALEALHRYLAVSEDPDTFGHCMCDGEERIELWEGDDSIVKFSLHHGIAIRCSQWQTDAALLDGKALVTWLSDHGVADPLVRLQEQERSQAEEVARLDQWQAAMPDCLTAFWSRLGETGWATFSPQQASPSGGRAVLKSPTPLQQELLDALEAAYPSVTERVRTLLAWYGSPTHDQWSGFPSYEALPGDLLLVWPTRLLVDALIEPLSRDVLEGAARLFAGWNFRRDRPDDLTLLPSALRQRLLAHSLQSTNEDKLARARSAFGAK
jgi:hypothetical protein